MKLAILLVYGLLLVCPPAFGQAAAPKPAASEEAKRERDLKVVEIIQALSVTAGARVADIGAGDGFYTARLAKTVGQAGRVYAEDIDAKGAIRSLRKRVKKEHLRNVTVVFGKPDDPKLPAGDLDGVLMVISYHEIEPHQKMLHQVLAALKPGGRFVVVDMTPHKTRSRPRADQTKNHVIAPELAEAEIREAGLEIVSRSDDFIDRPDEESTRWMIVSRRVR